MSALNHEKDEILAIAAHDLRNPMAANRQLAAMLLEEDSELSAAERRDFLQDMMLTADATLEIVSKLLEANRLESGTVRCKLESVQVTDCIATLHRQFAEPAERKQQHLAFDLAGTDPHVTADKVMLQQVLDNLVSNAIKYSPVGSLIQVTAKTTPDDAFIRFEVKDQGPGIPQAEMSHLFKKFSRLKSKPTGGETSTGLGLSIAHKLTELMQGKIWCESIPGQGSSFFVELPCAK